MKKFICDLCKKEINKYDIPISFELKVGEKIIEQDMHSRCYYEFVRALGKEVEDDSNKEI